MGFMQKNVNTFVLLLVLVVAGALAGSSVYYQKTFDKLTDKFEVSQTNLTECTTDLNMFRSQLVNTQTTLNTTTQDIRRYDELYSNKSAELESTKDNLEDTEKALTQTQVNLQEANSLKTKYQNDYQEQLSINADLEEQNTLLTAQKNQLEQSVLNYRSDIEDSEECIDEFILDYSSILTSGAATDIEACKP